MSRIKSALRAQATPLTLGLFLVSTISGIALFLHVGTTWFREMHEILSLVLLVPVVLHVWRNWLPLKIYMRHAGLYVGLAISMALAVPFLVEAAGGGASAGNPMFAMVRALESAPIAVLAPAVGLDMETASAALGRAGVPDAGPEDTVAGLAAESGRSAVDLMAVLAAARQPR